MVSEPRYNLSLAGIRDTVSAMFTSHFWQSALLLLGLGFIIGCTESEFTVDLTPLQNGNAPTIQSGPEFPEWTEVADGIELKQQVVEIDNNTVELFTMVRFDPAESRLRIAVDTADPKTISAWQESLQAKLVMNGSYFDELYQLTTQVITSDGTYGLRLTGKTAFMQTQDGTQWSIVQAEQAADQVQASLQSYPLLVQHGEPQVETSSDNESARTIVALDADGNMYFIIAEYGFVNLHELDDVIATKLDVELDTALNLDGGTSTGLVVAGDQPYLNDSVLVPAVLYVQ